jgi:hypothetical protein
MNFEAMRFIKTMMKGDVNPGDHGKLTVGDPALFIGSSEVSADTSFGCEQMSKKRTSLIYLFILISLISLPLFFMKLKVEKMFLFGKIK